MYVTILCWDMSLVFKLFLFLFVHLNVGLIVYLTFLRKIFL